jgi:alkanesulfonate monooxygenase SsuD/methylene tetrahydromethanopterin reductase-like flavin-dependent oxidoreductase (luciferase family)
LRSLWTTRSVTLQGSYDKVTGAGIAPMPIQRPIPIWFGGMSTKAFERMGRLADGWFPMVQPGPDLDAAREIIATSARQAGRDPDTIGMEGRVDWRGDADDLARRVSSWREAGATHVSVNTMRAGLATVDHHLGALGRVADALGLR